MQDQTSNHKPKWDLKPRPVLFWVMWICESLPIVVALFYVYWFLGDIQKGYEFSPETNAMLSQMATDQFVQLLAINAASLLPLGLSMLLIYKKSYLKISDESLCYRWGIFRRQDISLKKLTEFSYVRWLCNWKIKYTDSDGKEKTQYLSIFAYVNKKNRKEIVRFLEGAVKQNKMEALDDIDTQDRTSDLQIHL